jgi:hypothetical protein
MSRMCVDARSVGPSVRCGDIGRFGQDAGYLHSESFSEGNEPLALRRGRMDPVRISYGNVSNETGTWSP